MSGLTSSFHRSANRLKGVEKWQMFQLEVLSPGPVLHQLWPWVSHVLSWHSGTHQQKKKMDLYTGSQTY